MSAISVVITAYNAQDYISETIKSVLNQSFTDFELNIVNYGSIDKIRSFADERIRWIDDCNPERFELLNRGIKASTGKYVVIIDSGSFMHVDMLKTHHSMMEEYPEITICGSWETVFGKRMSKRIAEQKVSGWVEMPLFQLMLDDLKISSTYTVRKSFIDENNLLFQHFDYAEDYQFWVETALLDGGFYINTQPLVYRRIVDTNMSGTRRLKKLQSISQVKNKILPSLCHKHHETYPALLNFYNSCIELSGQNFISEEDIFKLFYSLFMKKKDELFKHSPFKNRTI